MQVLVQDDDIEEDTEMIVLSLALVSSPSNIVVELGRATTEISVVDNDNLPGKLSVSANNLIQ